MACKVCQSENQKTFESEVTIHFPELDNLRKRPILVFPDLVICLNCGFIESKVEMSELLRQLGEGTGRG